MCSMFAPIYKQHRSCRNSAKSRVQQRRCLLGHKLHTQHIKSLSPSSACCIVHTKSTRRERGRGRLSSWPRSADSTVCTTSTCKKISQSFFSASVCFASVVCVPRSLFFFCPPLTTRAVVAEVARISCRLFFCSAFSLHNATGQTKRCQQGKYVLFLVEHFNRCLLGENVVLNSRPFKSDEETGVWAKGQFVCVAFQTTQSRDSWEKKNACKGTSRRLCYSLARRDAWVNTC